LDRRRIKMCEAHAFILQDEQEVKLLESVDELEVHGEEIRLINIFGEQKIIKGKLKSYNNSERKILLEAFK
jgi:predicted RNA-binding protein